eukprot:547775-Rhodomonas_salina.2
MTETRRRGGVKLTSQPMHDQGEGRRCCLEMTGGLKGVDSKARRRQCVRRKEGKRGRGIEGSREQWTGGTQQIGRHCMWGAKTRDPRWRGIGLLVDQRPGVPLCRGQSGRYGRTARRTVTAAASLPQGRGRAIRAILGNWSGSILSILRLVPTQVPEIAG